MEKGWIRLNRRILSWHWYQESTTFRVFIHLLLKANYETRYWRHLAVKRGDLITSLSSLSRETGLSIQSVRTALKHLKKTGEIQIRSTHQYSLITIINYHFYQPLSETKQMFLFDVNECIYSDLDWRVSPLVHWNTDEPNKIRTISKKRQNNSEENSKNTHCFAKRKHPLFSSGTKSALSQKNKKEIPW